MGEEMPRTTAPAEEAAQATVLVVDDEPSIRQMLELLLEAEGLRVVTAGDGIDALRVVETEPPAVVVTDLMMPRLDGHDLIARLRAGHVPVKGIIAMSAATVAAERPPQADFFIAKPFDVEQVVRSIFALLTDAPDAPPDAPPPDAAPR